LSQAKRRCSLKPPIHTAQSVVMSNAFPHPLRRRMMRGHEAPLRNKRFTTNSAQNAKCKNSLWQ